MLVSVIIPVYNCLNTLESTIASIQGSGLKDYEILLIDDGSLDGSSALCDRLSEEIDLVRCIHQKNGGVSSARNCGIKTALGEYILFMDSDDTLDPGSLEHVIEILCQNNLDMLIFGLSFDYYYHRKLYRRDTMVYHKKGLLDSSQWGRELPELFMINALSPAWNKLIRRELLISNHIGFHQELIEMEDFLFTINCLKFCENIYLLPVEVYRYRQAEDERSTYNRLLKIPSLTIYMEPFEKDLKELAGRLILEDCKKNELIDIASQIYRSFFYEVLRFGDIQIIQKSSMDMLNGKYAKNIKADNPGLYQWIEEHRYCRIWLRSIKKRVRHWVAVRIKYLQSVGGLT